MKKQLALLAFATAICSSAAIQPAVAIRFDDNHTVERWETLAKVFRKHNVRFSFSIIPMFREQQDPAWCKKICQLQDEGFEVMDHTPQHTTVTVTLPAGDPRLETLKTASFVDHIYKNKVCIKCYPAESKFSAPFAVKIFDKNKITATDKTPFKLARRMNFEIDGKHYYLTSTPQAGVFKLITIWNEDNVVLPDGEKTARRCLKESFDLAEGGYDFLIQCSQDGFRKIGLKKMPRVWIQPGGYYPHLAMDKLANALRKYDYISGSCQQNGSMKGYLDPEFEDRRFSMLWGDFNFEKLKFAPQKTRIADTLACRKVAIGSSHLTPAQRDGKLKEYAAMYEQLLPWLKANNIKVMTQGELAEHLRDTKIAPKENIMPSLAKDIDENNRPDGYIWRKGSGAWDKKAAAISIKGKGVLLKVKELCGLPKCKVRFSMEVQGKAQGKVTVHLIDSLKKPCGMFEITLNENSKDWQAKEMVFDIPEKCAALNFAITAATPSNCKVRNLDLRAAK